ncbi:hypothetical protein T439DRAFT_188455 [Meredithblackwellia eburnea MCA 4105]
MDKIDFSAALFAHASSSKASASGDGAAEGGQDDHPKKKEKVQRIVRACDACRRRKSKCSGGDPCTECVTFNRLPCTYERPRRLPPKTYAESLEHRLASLEGVLKNIGRAKGLDFGEVLDIQDEEEKVKALEDQVKKLELGGLGAGTGAHGGSSEGSAGSPASSGGADAEGRSLEKDVVYDRDRFVGRHSGPAIAQTLLKTYMGSIDPVYTANYQQVSLVDQMMNEGTSDKATDVPFPPPDLAGLLVDKFFEHIYPLAPILHRPSLARGIKSGLIDTNPSFRRLVLAIFALGARFVTDSRLPTHPIIETAIPRVQRHAAGYAYHQASWGQQSPTQASATLFDLQSLVLGVIWISGAASTFLLWQSVGTAIRRLIDVGAHVEERERWNESPLEDQLRKRAAHFLLTIDRKISTQLGRPLALQDDESDLSYPIDITDEDLDQWNLQGRMTSPSPSSEPTAVAGQIMYSKLLKISASIIIKLYRVRLAPVSPARAKELASVVMDLDSALNQWLSEMPSHLKWNPEKLEPQFLVSSAQLQCAFYFCESRPHGLLLCSADVCELRCGFRRVPAQVLLHRDFLMPEKSTGGSTPAHQQQVFPSIAICGNAARSCCHILYLMKEKELLQDMFFFAPLYPHLQTAMAGLISCLLLIRQGTTDRKSSTFSDILKCREILDDLAPSTLIAGKMLLVMTAISESALLHNQTQAAKKAKGDITASTASLFEQRPKDPILSISPLPAYAGAPSYPFASPDRAQPPGAPPFNATTTTLSPELVTPATGNFTDPTIAELLHHPSSSTNVSLPTAPLSWEHVDYAALLQQTTTFSPETFNSSSTDFTMFTEEDWNQAFGATFSYDSLNQALGWGVQGNTEIDWSLVNGFTTTRTET